MKKTTQNCFCFIIIFLLTAQYTYTSFENASLMKLSPTNKIKGKWTQILDLKNKKTFFFSKTPDDRTGFFVCFKETKNTIADFSENENIDNIALQVFVLTVDSTETFSFSSSCITNIMEIKAGETKDYFFRCFYYSYILEQKNREITLYFEERLSENDQNKPNIGSDQLLYSSIETKKYYSFSKEDTNQTTITYFIVLNTNKEEISVQNYFERNINNFRAKLTVHIFVLDKEKHIQRILKGIHSGNLIENSLEYFFPNNSDIETFLRENKLNILFNNETLDSILTSDIFKLDSIKNEEDTICFFISSFEIKGQSGYLIPSKIKLPQEQDSFVFSVYLIYENKSNIFKFFVDVKNQLIYPECYVLENGFKIKYKFSSEVDANNEIKLILLIENEKIELEEKSLKLKIPIETINILTKIQSDLFIKKLFHELNSLHEKSNEDNKLYLESNKIMGEYIFEKLIDVLDKTPNILDMSVITSGLNELKQKILQNKNMDVKLKNKLIFIYDDIETNYYGKILMRIDFLKKTIDQKKERIKSLELEQTKGNTALNTKYNKLKADFKNKEKNTENLNEEINRKAIEIKELLKKVKTYTETESELTTVKK